MTVSNEKTTKEKIMMSVSEPIQYPKPRVRDMVLVLLSTRELRFSDFEKALQKPGKTIFFALKELSEVGLITKNQEGKYILTDEGKEYLKKSKLIQQLKLMRLFSEILNIILEESPK